MPALIAALAAVLLLADNWLEPYRARAAGIIHAATGDDRAWRQLAFMTDTFGPRLSGTPALDAALRWAAGEMKQDFDEVRLDPVKVPRWVRGTESLEIVAPFPAPLVMLGLGNSVGTSGAPLEAELLVVRSFAELDASGARAKGRIVLFNVPYAGYGETVRYRAEGPSRAAARGAVAALVRSVGLPGLRTPHTGALQYTDADPRVPAAAIPTEDADRLQRMQDRGTRVVLRLRMDAQFLPDAESANLVADYRGRELPDEIVAIGCHIDSWDVGTGATDDGGGCIAMWEAVRVLKTLGLRPRRTIRVVFWTNEENGLRGGLAYRDRYRAQLGKHVMMMESDSGVFRPIGFRFTGPERGRALLAAIATLLAPIDATRIAPNGGGADIGPSVEAGGIPAMSLDVDGSRYFLVHHTQADTVDKIDPADLSKCVAAVAVMSYVVADMPGTLR